MAVASNLRRVRAGRADSVVARLRRRARAVPLPLALLAGLALVQALAWALATAPLNGPDETSHAAYAQHVAETGDGPLKNEGTGGTSTEMSTLLGKLNLGPIIGHAEGRPTWTRVDQVADELERQPASAREDGSGPNPAASNPPLYYAYAAIAYRLSPDQSLLGRLFAMRVATALLLPLTVVLSWLVAAELFASALPRVLTAGLVALQPKLGFMAGLVNPDMLLFALSTAVLLVALRTARHGLTWPRVVGLALLAGAGVATHGRGLALVPPALAAIAIAWWRFRPSLRAGALQAGTAAGILLASGLLVVLYTRSHSSGVAFGGQTGIGGAAFNVRQFLSYLWQFYLPRMTFMDPMLGPPYGYRQVWIESFFGTFSSLEVNFRLSTYDKLQIAAGVGLLALYTLVVVRRRRVLSAWPAVAVCVVAVVSMLGVVHVASYRALQGGPDPVFTGRYLLPCVALYGAAVAWVVTSLPRRVAPVAAAVVLAAATVLSVGGIGLTLLRFHA